MSFKVTLKILLLHLLLFYAGSRVFAQDTDGDGVTNANDMDDDNDGVTDAQESFILYNFTPPCGTVVTPDFSGTPNLISGTDKQVGATYRVSNVLTGIDALLQIEQRQNISDFVVDDNSQGRAASLQPNLSATNVPLNAEAYVQYKITFVTTGTSNPVKLTYMYANFADIDGSSNLFGDVEYFADHVSYSLQQSTLVTVTPSVYSNNVNWTKVTAGYSEVNAVDTVDKTVAITARYANFSSLRIRFGDVSRLNNVGISNRMHRVDFTCILTYASPLTNVLDFDEDGVQNVLDLDSDNDAISDIREAGGTDPDNNGIVGSGTTISDPNANGLAASVDPSEGGTAITIKNTDADSNPDFLDTDSDGDGISDLIEAQSTQGFVALTHSDQDLDGVDDAFDNVNGFGASGLKIPVNTDGTDNPDYTDLNSENDSRTDAVEGWDTDKDGVANTVATGKDLDKDGLDDGYDANRYAVNPGNGQTPASFPDTGGTSERDWREFYVFQPVANPDNLTTAEDTPIDLTVLFSNDVASNDGPSTTAPVTVSTAPLHGTITVNNNGTPADLTDDKYTYVPTANYYGNDSFIYKVCDANNDCDTAKVNITITSVNDAPVANEDDAATDPSIQVTVNAAANDTDVDQGTVFTFSLTSYPAGTTASINAQTGVLTYTPTNSGTPRRDTIRYTVCDNGTPKLCANGIILVTIPSVPMPPTAKNDALTVNEDTPGTSNVASNDSDINGNLNPTNVTVAVNPKHGTATVNATTGYITYTPAHDYNGADSLTYTICDNTNLCSNAKLLITVTPVNDAPYATDDSTAANPSVPVTINLASNDGDVDSNVLTYTLLTQPASTNANLNSATGVLIYTPSSSATIRQDIVTYKVCDNANPSLCANAKVTITVPIPDTPPVANNDAVTADEDTQASFNVLSNDTDVNSNIDPTTLIIITAPKNGTASVAGGQISYKGSLNYNGRDSVQYRICDLTSKCDTAWALITVKPVNDAPVVDNEFNTFNEDTPVNGDLTNSGDYDPDNTQLSVSGTLRLPAHGQISINSDGSYTYTPFLNYNGKDTVIVKICDGGLPLPAACTSDTVFLSITPVNDAPVANPVLADADPGTPTDIYLNENVSDPDAGTVFTYTLLTSPAGTTATLNAATGLLTYTPKTDNTTRADMLSYKVCDNTVPSLCATNTIDVAIPNRKFHPKNDTASINEDEIALVHVLVNDTAFNAVDTSSLAILTAPLHGTATVDISHGTITYTPALNYYGKDTLTYNLCKKDHSECKTAKVFIDLAPVNDLTVVSDHITVGVDGEPFTTNFISNDIDPENTGIAAQTLVRAPSHGQFSYTADGSYSYVPAEGSPSGTDTVVVEVCDHGYPLPGLCSNDTILITIKQHFFVSDGFTPNGDGVNDYFIVETQIPGPIQLKVFNRWGTLVFTSDDYKNEWDGRSNTGLNLGEKLTDGTYFSEVTLSNGEVKRRSLTLLK